MKKFQKQRRRFLLSAASGLLLGPGASIGRDNTDDTSPFLKRLQKGFIEADNIRFNPTSYSIENSGVCVASAEAILGPYYAENASLERVDITEGKQGVSLDVILQIVDVNNNCEPLTNAIVDIWHCDSRGYYSQFTANNPLDWPSKPGVAEKSDNETFLRGRQISDETGKVQFKTIYPGWYSPRTQHIHARIFLDEKVAATIQLYFPDRLNKMVSLMKPYNQRTPSPYTNQNDAVIGLSEGADGSWLHMTEQGDGFRGTLTVGILRAS